MGTRSLTHIKDDNGKTLATVYRQYDGYPTGMGMDIREALSDGQVKIVNGYSMGDEAPKTFNGMGCLGAFLIGELKEKKIGNVYLYPADSEDVGEEYVYTLTPHEGTVKMKVFDPYYKKTLFDGILAEFDGELVEAENNPE